MAALFCLLLLPVPDPFEGFERLSRDERERAVLALAASGPSSEELLARLRDAAGRPPDVVEEAILELLARRADDAALRGLAGRVRTAGPEPAEAAARALLAGAAAAGEPRGGEALALPDLPAERMRGAVRAAVDRWLDAAGEMPDYDGSAAARPMAMLGPLAYGELGEAARDGARLWKRRRAAMVALARAGSEEAAPRLAPLLDDDEPMVRAAAGELLLRLGTRGALEAVAATLGRGRAMEQDLQRSAMTACERLGSVDDAGAATLLRTLREGSVDDALAAAAALRRARPGPETDAAIAARCARLLDREERSAGSGALVALFELRAGPLDAPCRERMARSGTALVRAAASSDRDEALAILRPLLDPEKPLPRLEHMRVNVAHRLLLRHAAPPEDRLRFAAANLSSDAPKTRVSGARILLGLPEAAREPLRPALERLLDDPREPVRLAAAAALPPGPRTRRILLEAVVDGDPSATAEALSLLRNREPGADLPSAEEPVASRRAKARRLLRADEARPR